MLDSSQDISLGRDIGPFARGAQRFSEIDFHTESNTNNINFDVDADMERNSSRVYFDSEFMEAFNAQVGEIERPHASVAGNLSIPHISQRNAMMANRNRTPVVYDIDRHGTKIDEPQFRSNTVPTNRFKNNPVSNISQTESILKSSLLTCILLFVLIIMLVKEYYRKKSYITLNVTPSLILSDAGPPDNGEPLEGKILETTA